MGQEPKDLKLFKGILMRGANFFIKIQFIRWQIKILKFKCQRIQSREYQHVRLISSLGKLHHRILKNRLRLWMFIYEVYPLL